MLSFCCAIVVGCSAPYGMLWKTKSRNNG